MKQIELDLHTLKRDKALDLLEEHRAALVDIAKAIAFKIAKKHGRVTSTDVISAMREAGHGDRLDAVDKRFMGAVFRAGNGWQRIGFDNIGSHRRPVSVWRLA